jgi:hypothetical protein
MASILGKMSVTAANLVDKTHIVNLPAPNGVGKKEGMQVYAGADGAKALYMATGPLDVDPWVPVTNGEQIDLTITWTSNPPTPGDTQTIDNGTVPTVAELGQAVANIVAKLNQIIGAVTPA